MSLDDVVSVNISKATSTPSQLGFGTPLILAYHTVTASILATYKSVKAITDAGFSVNHPAVKMATVIFSQNPRPDSVMIGKRSTAFTQTIEIVPAILTAGYHYIFSVSAPDGTSWSIDYTVLAGATLASVCTALAPLIKNGNADITSTAAATKITVSCAAGKLFDLSNLPPPDKLKIKDVTTDPGIASDLTAIETLDPSSWYGVVLDYAGKATALAAAAWIEARKKLFFVDTSDQECTDSAVTTDLGSALKALSYERTVTLFSQKSLLSYGGAAWLGLRLPTTPGKANWAYCTLAGVAVSELTDDQKTVLHGKKINTYTTLAGAASTQEGWTSSGEFVDITHGTDWLQARIQERVFATIKNASDSGFKIPYTDAGVDAIRAAVLSVLDQGIQNGFLSDTPAPTCSFPPVDEIDDSDKINRTLPDGAFSAPLAGAINKTRIDGTLTI